jgi:hypothetical protein
LAGVPGFEPGLSVLETDVLTVDTIPLRALPIFDCRFPIGINVGLPKSAIGNQQIDNELLGFFMISVLAATVTELTKLKPIGRGLLVLGRNVVSTFTLNTLKHNIIAWHNLFPDFRFPIANLRLVLPTAFSIGNRQSKINNAN